MAVFWPNLAFIANALLPFKMYLFKNVNDLQSHLNKIRKKGGKIGFVPTMGALHHGHLSLIRQSVEANDCTVCSIFVNPTQFNDDADLEKYPRTVAKDMAMLTSVDNDVLFLPDVSEIYPPGLNTELKLDFGELATVMEGYFRPGHFDGMAQVVKRLLDIVEPHSLYMGQKDFQQLAIVRNMLTQLKMPINLEMCAIIRQEDGLAMSSRNVRLEPALREKALLLSQTLQKGKAKMATQTPAEIQQWAIKELTIPSFKPEYFEIVNAITLQPIESFSDTDYVVACTAVWVGEIRLIDNLIYKNK